MNVLLRHARAELAECARESRMEGRHFIRRLQVMLEMAALLSEALAHCAGPIVHVSVSAKLFGNSLMCNELSVKIITTYWVNK